jgi:hypothetical protein
MLKRDLSPQSVTPNSQSSDWNWPFWFVLPLYPYSKRQTIRREIVKETIWSFEQSQGILYAVVPIRMTIVKLHRGGLLVYAPIAPTKECIRLVHELEAKYGEVKYIIHPTSSGLEHKVFVGPFAKYFPQAQIFVAPHQWSFPLNLPLPWLGFPADRTYELVEDQSKIPFADEFDYQILNIDLRKGYFGEVALYHWRSQTLLLTDTIISIPEDPPLILQINPYPLLFHARENALEKIEDNQANRLKGWKRICLFAVYFRPDAVEPIGLGQLLKEGFKAPDKSRKAYFGLFPFHWKSHWPESFQALRANGRPFVAPILQVLIFPQDPQKVREWANKVANWNFQQIISGHFDAPIKVSPSQFREAFSFLEKTRPPNSANSVAKTQCFPNADLKFIQNLEAQLVRLKIATPPPQC